MKTKVIDIGAFEAKTRLSELLRETERGASFVIRRKGKAVARLIPPHDDEPRIDFSEIARQFREIRAGVRKPVRIKGLIEMGRRF